MARIAVKALENTEAKAKEAVDKAKRDEAERTKEKQADLRFGVRG